MFACVLALLLSNAVTAQPDTQARERLLEQLVADAHAFQARGFKRRALPLLERAANLDVSKSLYLPVQLDLAGLLFDLGAYTEAEALLVPMLSESEDPGFSARVRNELGLVVSLGVRHQQAAELFEEALSLLEDEDVPALRTRIQINHLKSLVALRRASDATDLVRDLQVRLYELPASAERIELMIAVATEMRRGFWTLSVDDRWLRQAHRLLVDAQGDAEDFDDPRLLSWATGYLGTLYEDLGEIDQAMAFSQAAVLHASEARAFESVYLWQWQVARLLADMGQKEKAIEGYSQAITSLEHVRQELIDGSPYTFHEKIQPLFSEMSDLLLQSAYQTSDVVAKQGQLRRVQDILEQAKSAEIQDYFQNQCVLPDESVSLNDVESGTATIYPIILQDRLEVLVGIDGTIHQYISTVDDQDFVFLVNEFRDQLEFDQGDDEYQILGEEIHDLLVAPYVDLLIEKNINTLVFVPDGVLRTVPISALFDGEEYLVEQFAIATTPGLKLTLPQPLALSSSSMFAGGISEALRGFDGLPGVPVELTNLKQEYGAAVLADSAFSTDAVSEQMSSTDYSIVHIATHGHFDSNPQKSFLLTYDDKLTMNMLEDTIGQRRNGGDPLEMLVLSACETAAGDNRAALGLAGVALKAGARSAVATLWQISDSATVRLVDEFYRQSSNTDNSKAEALRKAQQSLIEDDHLYHPSDWAPFLLIGNWL
ncbi:MAG: CHAT domain-containing protein [Pseudomonadota bacterium]